jgi:hypothetical protein
MRTQLRRWELGGALWGALLCGLVFLPGCDVEEDVDEARVTEELLDGLDERFGDPMERHAC